ncbi:MAG: Chromosome partition protein smc, partial [Myxococcaceae bacterium]|nr:Chromosome partition protein smc [Myxococcaceae bacterium]
SAAIGKKLLDDTEAEWKQVLGVLAKTELGLPADKLSRAELPRLLRPSTAADANFPKAEQAARATALLGTLGLYGLPGLTLDLAESAKKNPLPLTVAPGGPADVRVSFRPAGGARDASALLGELGRALALHGSREPAEALPRLAGPLAGDVSFRLFADLAASPGWLKAQGVPDAAAASTLTSARALRLFTLRRAAANLVAQHEALGQGDEIAAQRFRTWASRALAIEIAPEDAARWPLERDPLFRGVELIEAPRLAELLRLKLSAQWWADPASADVLRRAWSGVSAADRPAPAATTQSSAKGEAGPAPDSSSDAGRAPASP